MESLQDQGRLTNMRKQSRWARCDWISMIYLIIWFLRELAPKLLKLKNKMETKYFCKIQKKRGKKVEKNQ